MEVQRPVGAALVFAANRLTARSDSNWRYRPIVAIDRHELIARKLLINLKGHWRCGGLSRSVRWADGWGVFGEAEHSCGKQALPIQ